MGNYYLPSSEFIGEPLDCRKLTFSLDFYRLNQDQVVSLRNDIIQWANELGNDEFIYSWSYDLKNISFKKLWEKLQCIPEPGKEQHIAFDACVKGTLINSKSTMNRFQREYKGIHPVYSLGWDHHPRSSSMDYLSYYMALFPNKLPNEETISKLHTIFREPNRKCLSLHDPFDFDGSFHAHLYKDHKELFFGTASVSIGAFCLGDHIDDYSEKFASFAKCIAEKHVHINARVGLQPHSTFGNHYLRYFGQYVVTDGSHLTAGCTPKEWYSTYFLRGVEWLNIVSPLARQHLESEGMGSLDEARASVQELLGGCIMARSKQKITAFEWEDAVALKRYLINAIHPGGRRMPLRFIFQNPQEGMTGFCPRNDWAIVPVEEGEIDIQGNELVYTSRTGDNLREP